MGSHSDDRRARILRAVVEGYVGTAEPVGSAYIVATTDIAVSSATIRNDMSFLESEGYLRQPHTSAGRVPTEKGYRRYVDELMGEADGGNKSDQVLGFFKSAHLEIDELLGATTTLLTNLTNCAAIITGPSPQRAQIISVKFVGLASRLVLAVVVDVNGSVEKRAIEWPLDVDYGQLEQLSEVMTDHFKEKEPHSVDEAPYFDDLDFSNLVSRCFVAVKSAVADAERDGVFIGGASTVAASFNALETVRGIISILERHYLVVSLLRSVISTGQAVAIGSEHGLTSLRECAVVAAPYSIDGIQVGSVGLIGPTRMNYGSVIGAVQLVSENLGKRLSEG
ncbi:MULTISPECIES: heat-inducible transcriptional repressor HrcA [Acidithrix]|uniref:Heat-inducible transcription repressor HrcA n=1 Tax=Acidithrix ferrooxidans TaxID=1280514 RepID=A0A0D8HEU4_9ACTN|nr:MULTISPECIES: heat-inducible transcriptional repressor HrcA [Acidithrix]KJF16480.1 heat-inducible transcription repressor HrcA [Acidithrix ferrooxidans]CAG4929016.1 unnamed protein product [Acidithrix sp. C25]